MRKYRYTALLAVLGSWFLIAPAQAHDILVDSVPERDQAFESPPARVEVTFNNEPLPIGGGILVVDPAGTDWVLGEPEYSGRTVFAEIDPDLPDGSYEARWRVVSSDGHPISGSIPFTVGDGAAPPAASTQDATGTPAGSSDDDGGETSPGTAGDAVLDGPAVAEPARDRRTVVVGVAGAAVAGLILALVTSARRRRSGGRDPDGSPQTKDDE